MGSTKKWLQQISVVAQICGIVFLVYVYLNIDETGHVKSFYYIIFGGLLLVSLVFADISSLSPPESHTFVSICSQYIFYRILNSVGYVKVVRFLANTHDTKGNQASLLMQIIKNNNNTRMGNILRLRNIKSVDQYLSKVKLTDYSFYELICQEIILYGESDGLFPGKLDCIARTSGYASGKSKIFLKSRLLNRKFQTYITLLLFFLQNTKGNQTLRRIQFVHVYPTFRYLQYKVIIQPISSMTEYVSQLFLLTPLKGGEITTEPEAFYIFLLFALAEDELGNMIFPNSSMALRYFKLLENRWEELLFDLENRNISENIQIAHDVRITCIISLYERIRSRRIKKLRTEFQKGFHEIVPRIWPTCPSISCISTGAFKEQTAVLKELYLGSIPVLGFGHFAAESIYGLNMNKNHWTEEYICVTPINFYEFIPLEDIEKDQPRTYLAHQVETWKMYEMVVTTRDGLYRYRSHDIVQITGFYWTTPTYKFIQSTHDVLALDKAKIWLFNVSSAIDVVSGKWTNKSVYEYTLVENCHLEKIEGKKSKEVFFVIFMELHPAKSCLSETDCSQIDLKLIKTDKMYEKSRRRGNVKPCRVWQVSPGTFDAVFDIILALNPEASPMQIKPQKVTRRPEILKYLMSKRI